jgi:hypothetical protein
LAVIIPFNCPADQVVAEVKNAVAALAQEPETAGYSNALTDRTIVADFH